MGDRQLRRLGPPPEALRRLQRRRAEDARPGPLRAAHRSARARAAGEHAGAALGEFGRTPKINKDAGRDHWPHAMSVLMAGAGIPGGQIVGATDAKGYYASENVYRPEDFAASLYTKMGIDPHQRLHTNTGPAGAAGERWPADQGAVCLTDARVFPVPPRPYSGNGDRPPAGGGAGADPCPSCGSAGGKHRHGHPGGKFDPWPCQVHADVPGFSFTPGRRLAPLI